MAVRMVLVLRRVGNGLPCVWSALSGRCVVAPLGR